MNHRIGMEYLSKLKRVRSPQRAATLVRAFACRIAACPTFTALERLNMVTEAEQLASQLDTYTNPEVPRAWRQLLTAAGY